MASKKTLLKSASVLVALIVIVGVSVASAAPASVSFDSITSSCGVPSSNPGSDAAVVITAQNVPNVAGNGVVGFELEVEYPHAQMTLDAVTPGSSMNALAGCSPSVQIGFDDGTFAWVSGQCTNTVPNPGAAGSNVELAVLHFSLLTSQPYTVRLVTTGVGVPTALIGPDNVIVNATAQQLISCVPTAVTMSGFDAATDSPAPFAAAAWPLLAGAAAVAAGGAYALLRRKS